MVKIAIVGAGIVGLSTAVNIQRLIPAARITIIADKFDTDTTSSGAGGLYRPTSQLVHGVATDIIKKWVKASWDYFTSLAMSSLAKETGQALVPGYVISNDRDVIENALYRDIVFNFRMLTEDEMKRLKFPFKYGSSFQTVITQPKMFMPWLMRQFKENGGTVEFHTVTRLEELAGAYNIVVNCSGLGSQNLIPDPVMYPVKGQLVMVRAPWIKTFLYCDAEDPTYFIPHNDKIIIGGTREKGNYSTDVSKDVQDAILKRAGEILPQVKCAEVIGNWSGLRPSRDPLRLEKELLDVGGGKKLRVVHNYGHGANGITLSWGTSLDAAKLTKEWADDINKQQSKL